MQREQEVHERRAEHVEAEARVALRRWFADDVVTLQPLGEGHINGTWRVELPLRDTARPRRYVLQKINQAVFADPSVLMGNLKSLFGHNSDLLSALAGDQNTGDVKPDYVLPEPLAALSGDLLVSSGTEQLPGGKTVACQWRLARFVEESRTLQKLSSVQQAHAAGQAFGEFQRWLGCLGETSFGAAIPGFHQLSGYLQALTRAEVSARGERQSLTNAEQTLLEQLRARDYLHADWSQGEVAIHGDCKINNLLFARDEERVVAILDLDTLMHGPWWLDFGDLVRSATCTEAGKFQREFYPALVDGFFTGRSPDADSSHETDGGAARAGVKLADALRAPAHMTYMLAVRFLTDHLQNDRYFRVDQRGDNLRRAQRQFRLLETLESADTADFMRDVLGEHF